MHSPCITPAPSRVQQAPFPARNGSPSCGPHHRRDRARGRRPVAVQRPADAGVANHSRSRLGKAWSRGQQREEDIVTALPVGEIRVGARNRRDLGDVASLAQSIDEIGLLHPIVITPDNTLIAGARRLEALKLLGWKMAPVTVVDLDQIVRGEFAENTERKPFTPSEMVAIAAAIEPLERAKAKQRQGERTDKHLENFSTSSSGRALDKAATIAGFSRPSLLKARAVVEAAEAEPERFGGLVEMMDENGRVDRAFKQLQNLRHQQEHSNRIEHGCTVDDLVALADSGKRFPLIYADPAWPWETWSARGKVDSAPDNHYGTSTIEQIKALPVAALAADDCALLLWGTWPLLPRVIEVIGAWGFTFKSCGFLWTKTTKGAEAVTLDGDGLHWGMGYFTHSNTEYCLLATRGSPKRIAEDVHQVIIAPVGEHGAKPEEVARRIERLFAGPYLELYARRPRENWVSWGDELPPTELQAAE
jgi:N6-adenosine-specific RNA methylase IME4